MPEILKNAGKQAGVEVFRIEKFEPKLISKELHGKFYTGDSYLILETKKVNKVIIYNLFFWIGNESSIDEYGAVAMWAVQLDDYITSNGGNCKEYRITQGNEINIFINLFDQVEYMKGGIETGFTH